ncbi:hypothetical protein ACEN8I_11970 [Polaromonas sp. CT11-55]|uniref:hypothetical protein n=1 Tax=Polaromonas sp. CT11-55 TaxID=3243045 RepID=UPI0039A6D221
MREMPLHPLHRSIRRFWNPVESRYWTYERPSVIEAICGQCEAPYLFNPDPVPTHQYDPEVGGYTVLKGEICGPIAGRGACGKCGKVATSLTWPEAAYIKIKVAEGILWSWNTEQLVVIRAHVAGDKAVLRKMLMNDWRLSRTIGRIPTFAILKRNRFKILSSIDRYLRKRTA